MLSKLQQTVVTMLVINAELNMHCVHNITKGNLISFKFFESYDFKA